MIKYTVEFKGRRVGAIGIFYPITYVIITDIKLNSDQIQLKLYESGFEHITLLNIIKEENDYPIT